MQDKEDDEDDDDDENEELDDYEDQEDDDYNENYFETGSQDDMYDAGGDDGGGGGGAHFLFFTCHFHLLNGTFTVRLRLVTITGHSSATCKPNVIRESHLHMHGPCSLPHA